MANTHEYRVYYEDTDTGGIVYHANYLKFCERARSDHIFAKGDSPLRGENHFVIASMNAKFKASAKLGDILSVTMTLGKVSRVSIEIYQTVSCEGKELFEMNGVFVLTNKEGRPIRLSEEDIEIFS